MNYKNIIVEQDNDAIILTVNRQAAMNALNIEMLKEIEVAFGQFDNDKVVIITGAGEKAFIAGADIRWMLEMDEKKAVAFAKLGHRVFSLIENFPMPVIAAINGYTLGGGCELALSCDIRIASDNAKFGQPEVNLGITPGFGSTQRIPRLIGDGLAKEMMFTGDMIDAERAFEIGLVNKVVSLSKLMSVSRDLAKKIKSKSSVALKATKSAINYLSKCRFDEGLDFETIKFSQCFITQDQKEGMKAFLEKKRPKFKGK